MSLDLGKFYKSLRDFVEKNPDAVANGILSVPVIVKMIKNGTLKAIMTETLKGIRGGFTVKQALSNAVSSSATTTAIGKGVKTAAVIAAAAFAFGTLKEAVKYGEATVKGDDTGWDKIWKFAWNTSIPGATVNQFRSFATWLKSKPSEQAKTTTWVTDPLPPVERDEESKRESKAPILDKVTFKGEPNKISAYTGFNYDEAAKRLGLGSRPANPQAENQWKKEVENQMKRQGSNTNSPIWYFQGLANKMLGTNLTWTGIKDGGAEYDFVSVVGLTIALTIPMLGRKIHPQITSNTNIEFQALRGKNTGAFQYTEENVYTYDMSISSLIAVVKYVQKLLAMSNSYDVQVEGLPKHLYTTVFGGALAKTIYDDVITNKPNYVTRLNSLAKDLNTYAFKGRTLNSRWNYIADKCLRDFDGPKAIYGVYTLCLVPSLDANGDLAYTQLRNFTTIKDFLDYIELQLDRLRTTKSGAYVKVAGDMIKLLGAKAATFSNVPYITGSEVLSFQYDAEAADQLRNAKVFPATGAAMPSYDGTVSGDFSIQLEGNTLVPVPVAEQDKVSFAKARYMVVTDRNKEFDAKDNLQLIQFTFNAKPNQSTSVTGPIWYIHDLGTTLLQSVRVVTYDKTTFAPVEHDVCGFISMNNTDGNWLKVNGYVSRYGAAANNYSAYLWWFTQVDFLPRNQIVNITNNAITFMDDWLDVDNYAYMTADQFRMLNNVAVYSQTFTFTPDAVNITGLIASN